MEVMLKYLNYLKEKQINEVYICLHDAPDPDAFGSACGINFILKQNGINSKIVYRGEISHPQNKAMMNMLSIVAEKINYKINNNKNKNEFECICVDCTPNNSCTELASLTIDHHKVKSESKFEIIDPSYGACSTIVWNIVKELLILDQIDKNSQDSIITFTSMLLGIRTDTIDLTSERMSKEDFIAYQELLELADKEIIQKIMNYPFPRYLYEKRMILHEKGNSHELNGVFVGGIGFIPSSQRDVIAILSDEYVRMESVSTAVIFAIIDKKFLEISVRSNSVSLDVNQMCKDLFGEFGGGSSSRGGAKVPLVFYSEIDDKRMDDLWDLTCNQMFKMVHKEGWTDGKKK